jgi:hypothetical protein
MRLAQGLEILLSSGTRNSHIGNYESAVGNFLDSDFVGVIEIRFSDKRVLRQSGMAYFPQRAAIPNLNSDIL